LKVFANGSDDRPIFNLVDHPCLSIKIKVQYIYRMKSWVKLFRSLISTMFAIGIVLLCSLVLFLLREILSTSVVALLYLVPVVISAALWGRVAGIAASVLSFLIYNFLFIRPYYTFLVAHPQDFIAMIVLLSVAILISTLMARVQANLEMVRKREREAIQLFNLSADLAGTSDKANIIRSLARRLSEFFSSTQVEVEIIPCGPCGEQISDRSTIVRVPNESEAVLANPARRIPLISPHGLAGEIRIWGIAEILSPEEERLIQTITRQAELALDRALLAESETRTRILEESDRLKTAILSSVSHELRTPLASIQASATSLFNPVVEFSPEARIELQSLLLEETEHMSQLVGNLLNMSRIESGALKLQRQWNSFAEIVDTCIKRLRRISTQSTMQVNVSEDLPLVSVDPVLVEQVIINLISNSIKFAPPQTSICIEAEADEQVMKVTVSNQGPPIPEEFIDHIFEKFYPIPGRDPTHSTGLGLSICKGIIEAHGGKIWAENRPVGVAFIFTLPLAWGGARPILPAKENEE
jgi:two-component system, OmpR family, sensor histidine kinase KdpD